MSVSDVILLGKSGRYRDLMPGIYIYLMGFIWWVQMLGKAWVTLGGSQGTRGNPSEASNLLLSI
jgi:hypothetical protein